MADVASDLKTWSTTAGSNLPSGATVVGTGLDDNFREIQKVVRQDLASIGADTASASNCDIGAVAGLFLTITGTTGITSFGTVSAGIWKVLTFSGALTITHNGTSLICPNASNITTTAGDSLFLESLGSGNWKVHKMHISNFTNLGSAATVTTTVASGATGTTQVVGDSSTKIATTAFADSLMRSYLAGLTMSTAGSSTTMSVAAGQAMDSTNTSMLAIAAFTKSTSSWAVGSGNGALDTGTTGGAASTWYYWYLIRRPDTGVVDLIFSLSSSSPTLPANYTQYRYIGAGKLDGSKNWTAFTQMGREFYWSTPIQDFSGSGSTSASTLTCTIPLGRKMKVFLNVGGDTASSALVYISDPSNADLAPSGTAAPGASSSMSGSAFANSGSHVNCWTNTSAQIRHRETTTATVRINTLGWLDLADSTI